MLAAEQPVAERLIDDPFARLVVDDDAIAAARADEALQHVIRLRTRYIDDAITTFVTADPDRHRQVVLLGAGLDARAYRMTVPATFFELDFPATLARKGEVLAAHSPSAPRTMVPVDLAAESFVPPLIDAGFDPARPAIVVWEGVSMYLSAAAAEAVVAQVGSVVVVGSQLVADYVEMAWFKDSGFERNTASIARQLDDGGERLKAGVSDMRSTLDANGFDVLDDVATEDLRPRYGLDPRERFYPARMVTATRRASSTAG